MIDVAPHPTRGTEAMVFASKQCIRKKQLQAEATVQRSWERHSEAFGRQGIDESDGCVLVVVGQLQDFATIPHLFELSSLVVQLINDWVAVVTLEIVVQHHQGSDPVPHHHLQPFQELAKTILTRKLYKTIVLGGFTHKEIGDVTSVHLHASDVKTDMQGSPHRPRHRNWLAACKAL